MTETSDTTPTSAPASSARGRKDGIEGMLLPQLKQLAGGLGIKTSGMRKGAVIEAIKAHQQGQGGSSSGGRARTPARTEGGGSQPSEQAAGQSTKQTPEQPTEQPTEQPASRDAARSTGRRQRSDQPAVPAAGSSAPQPSDQPSQDASVSADAGADAGAEPAGPRAGSRRARAREERPAEQAAAAEGDQSRRSADGQQDARRGGQKDGQKDGQKGPQKDDEQRGGQQNSRQRPDRQQNDRQQNDRQQNDRQQGDRQQGDRQQNDRQQNDRNNDRQQNDRQQNDRNNDRQQNDRQQNDRNNDRQQDGQDDDEGGSRRNRRRRGRDRQGAAAPVASSRGHRNEPDLQILEDDVLTPCAGILDLMDNYAFVRTSGYLPGVDDVYVSMSMVRRYGLRRGDAVTGQVRQPREGERKEKFNPLVRLDNVNGADPETARSRVEFAKLTPLYPSERLRLETGPTDLIGRAIDVAAPIGKGQRGLIVSPAKAGKTVVLQALASSITTNNPECHLMVVLVDERPEEVTDFERSVKGEVISSTFDRPASDHTIVAELAIERAMRLVELGHDVVVLLDGITRLGRAYNLAAPASGRILAGGVDSAALYPPKRFFGAARNIENGGSLTIIATALVESGSAMDEVIFEEFKGTGNMEIRLRRDFADKRIFPAIDAVQSGTRREELLMSPEELAIVWKLRRALSELEGQQAVELLLGRLRSSQSNMEFLRQVQKATPTLGAGPSEDG